MIMNNDNDNDNDNEFIKYQIFKKLLIYNK